MIIVDTNVISELMRPIPNPKVLDWIASQDRSNLFTTTVTEAELRYGVEILPAGRRRDSLFEQLQMTLREDFPNRILAFDRDEALAYALVGASRRSAGLSVVVADCMIAAIARSHDASIATRDVTDFERSGVPLINPWSHP